MERNSRKVYVGRVVSAKNDKTITVLVETYRKHPLYGKRVKYSKKFRAHDELNTAKEGDIVEGIVRNRIKTGVFVELKHNLVGLAEHVNGIEYGLSLIHI